MVLGHAAAAAVASDSAVVCTTAVLILCMGMDKCSAGRSYRAYSPPVSTPLCAGMEGAATQQSSVVEKPCKGFLQPIAHLTRIAPVPVCSGPSVIIEQEVGVGFMLLKYLFSFIE